MEYGELSVMIIGTSMMLMLCAACWGILQLLLQLYEVALEVGAVGYGLTMWPVLVERRELTSVYTVDGDLSAHIVLTEEKLEFYVEVWSKIPFLNHVSYNLISSNKNY